MQAEEIIIIIIIIIITIIHCNRSTRKPKIQTLVGQRSNKGYKSFSKQTRYPTV
jgi:hypothetical protein